MKGSAPLAPVAPVATASISAPNNAPTGNTEIIQTNQEQFYPTPDPARPSRPTKPILKHRPVEYNTGQTGGERAGRIQGLDGNWYTNPLDCTYYPANNYHQVSQTFTTNNYISDF